MYILGIDGGGTKTTALIADEYKNVATSFIIEQVSPASNTYYFFVFEF